MKRQNRFIIGLLSAGITFSVLTATIGTDHWNRGYFNHPGYHYYHHHDQLKKSENDDSVKGENENQLSEE